MSDHQIRRQLLKQLIALPHWTGPAKVTHVEWLLDHHKEYDRLWQSAVKAEEFLSGLDDEECRRIRDDLHSALDALDTYRK